MEWCHKKYAERYNYAMECKQKGHWFTYYTQDLINRQREIARNRKYKMSQGKDVFYCTDEMKRNGTRYLVSLMCSRKLIISKDRVFLCRSALLWVAAACLSKTTSCLAVMRGPSR